MFTTRSLYTKAGFEVNQSLQWRMLSDDQCEEIVMSAMELLERTGVDVMNAKARGICADGGCWVEGNRVRIPSVKTEWALRCAPSRITVCNRNGKRAMLLENNNVHFGPGFGNDTTIDVLSGETKRTTKQDVANIAKICDGLPNIDFVMNNGIPTDVKENVAELHSFEAMVTYSEKPIVQEVKNVKQAKAVIDMAAAVAGSLEKLQQNPFLVLYVHNDEALVETDEAAEVLMLAAENNIPVICANDLVTGLTAPKESAAALVVALANALGALVISQLTKEGAPFITGSFFSLNDTDNDVVPYGAPEISLLGAGMANVLRFLRIPSFTFAGGSDAKTSDAQMGLEATFSILHAGLAGTSMVYGAGQMESGLLSSPYLVVMAEEVMGMTRRIMRGVEMDEDRLCRGVIDDVQPGGHYLGSPHTQYYFKDEQFWPTLMNRNRIDDWIAAGSKTLGERSAKKAQDLLNFYQGQALCDDTVKQLSDILAKAEKNM